MSISIVFATIVTLAACGAVLYFSGIGAGILFWIAASVLWFVLLIGAHEALIGLTRGMASEIPVRSAGELAQMVLTMNFAEFKPESNESEARQLSQEAVWEKIVSIFSEQMQIDKEEIVPEASIADDLRIE